jgi:choline dehydrogenase-like flavoprotein
MSLPKLFNVNGYVSPDPLDKANGIKKYVIMAVAQFIVTFIMLAIELPNIIQYEGFNLLQHHFSPHITEVLEYLMSCLAFSILFVLFRSSSSLLKILIPFIAYFPLDIYIWSHFRLGGDINNGLWTYPVSSFLWALKYPIVISLVAFIVDGLIFGVVGVFLARIIAQIIYSGKPYPNAPTEKQYNDLFTQELSGEDVVKPKRDWAFWTLRILGFIYLIYLSILILGKLGAAAWPTPIAFLINTTYENPALAINTYIKICVMIALAFIGAYNKSLRFYSCIGLITGHLVSTIASMAFYFYDVAHPGQTRDFLWQSAAADGLMVIIFTVILFCYKKDAVQYKPEKDFPIYFSIPMTLMQYMFRALGAFFLLAFGVILYLRLNGSGLSGLSAVYGYPDPMLCNTFTLFSTLAALSFLLIKRELLRTYFFNLIALSLLALGTISLLWIGIIGSQHTITFLTRYYTYTSVDWYFVVFAIVNLVVAIIMIGFRRMYYNIDFMITTLSPTSAINVMALTNALFGGNEKQHSEILRSIDNYAGGIRGRKRGIFNFPFGILENVFPLVLGLHPSFSSMSKDEQRYFMRKYLLRNDVERNASSFPGFAGLTYQIGVMLNLITTFANYSNLNVRYKIGFIPLDARDRLQHPCADFPPPYNDVAPLPKDHMDPNNFVQPQTACTNLVAPRVTTPVKEDDIPDEVDYIIIGSGAGGATMAYRLAVAAGKDADKILVVERGYRCQPLQDMKDDEMEMMMKLYKEGALQQTKKANMTILQGECVGGTTVVNNAVCFQMPDKIKNDWQNSYGIDLSNLNTAYAQVAAELNIQKLGQLGINQKVSAKFYSAVSAFNNQNPGDALLTDVVSVNHLNNIGDGNWNLGNKRMRKRSMLETFIPWSEARGVKVVSNMTAVRFTTSSDSSGKADGVILRADNGTLKKVKVKKAVIVAGGVIASTNFLMRSEVKNKNLGNRMSCNLAMPLIFDFDEEMKAFDGEQITIGALDPQSRAAFETYFNPPSAYALSSVPFFFDKRDEIMSRYKYQINFGALVGSEANGRVLRKPDLMNGQSFNWQLGNTDIKNIKYAVNTLIDLGKYAGSNYCVLPTTPGIKLSLKSQADIDRFKSSFDKYPLRMKDMFVATAHPQGGNAMAKRNSANKDQLVVNEDFLVNGYKNVFVADASLFPTSITINPQWTIMAMSTLASQSVLRNCP